ncbi:hypothetical protein H5410_045857 [Solanum commersonii]|uniref:Uncharacterized protein n=1 Tax=Solanum commersonii TaxID=4109 RepID=A0A9J5XCU8_SOLCO|nr:hypothetical protein H5410_045857 [Solanum commersonii]
MTLRYQEWQIFFNTMEAFNGLQTREYAIWWKGNSREEFKFNSAYRHLLDNAHVGLRGFKELEEIRGECKDIN